MFWLDQEHCLQPEDLSPYKLPTLTEASEHRLPKALIVEQNSRSVTFKPPTGLKAGVYCPLFISPSLGAAELAPANSRDSFESSLVYVRYCEYFKTCKLVTSLRCVLCHTSNYCLGGPTNVARSPYNFVRYRILNLRPVKTICSTQ